MSHPRFETIVLMGVPGIGTGSKTKIGLLRQRRLQEFPSAPKFSPNFLCIMVLLMEKNQRSIVLVTSPSHLLFLYSILHRLCFVISNYYNGR
ncbi:hypothetical protein MKW98_016794 [Papaver atlanticum]|uniref:Uncharacterized protein n=1 Tax=Papaver atlanticum TaxID=357466 RepID=A0AAD4TJT8_9MAGN|nr:hypothetical protein MKW98_016794 [Papaver atlanticum]